MQCFTNKLHPPFRPQTQTIGLKPSVLFLGEWRGSLHLPSFSLYLDWRMCFALQNCSRFNYGSMLLSFIMIIFIIRLDTPLKMLSSSKLFYFEAPFLSQDISCGGFNSKFNYVANKSFLRTQQQHSYALLMFALMQANGEWGGIRESEKCVQWASSHAAHLSAHVSGGDTDVQSTGINTDCKIELNLHTHSHTHKCPQP